MAKLEDVLPALREGKKIRAKGWRRDSFIVILGGGFKNEFGQRFVICSVGQLNADWEIVPESVRVADYLVPITMIDGWIINKGSHYERQTHPIGQQPEGSVLVPGTERDEYSEVVE